MIQLDLAEVARRVVGQLVKQGKVTRSNVGIVPGVLQDLKTFYALDQNTGMLINRVDPGSPVARVGLRGGDIRLSINGRKVDGWFAEQRPEIQHQMAIEPIGNRSGWK